MSRGRAPSTAARAVLAGRPEPESRCITTQRPQTGRQVVEAVKGLSSEVPARCGGKRGQTHAGGSPRLSAAFRARKPRLSATSCGMAFRCTSCGDVIGVYELAVLVDELGARYTSLAADPDIELQPGTGYYHRSCYAEDDPPPDEP